MPYYTPPVVFEPHDFTSSTLTINCPGLSLNFAVDGLDTIEVEKTDDRWTADDVNSGMTIPVHNPRRKGMIKLTLLDASPDTTKLSQIANGDEPCTVTFTDQNAPDLNCSGGQCYLQKHAIVKRSGEPDKPEWVFSVSYLQVKSGGYRLQTTD
jgi:hypothetical protein